MIRSNYKKANMKHQKNIVFYKTTFNTETDILLKVS